MLDILQQICDKSEKDVFTHAVCDVLGVDWLTFTSENIAEVLTASVMREVNERYQLCPLDKNGEPIHAGDYLETIGRVQAIGEDMVCAGDVIYSDDAPCYSGYAHFASEAYAKSNPVRDVLREFAEYVGIEATPYSLSLFESRLKALQ